MGRNNRMFNEGHFSLGFFSFNCDGGNALTTAPERWTANWRTCTDLAIAADDAGLEFMLPISRWIGWGGPSRFHDEGVECLVFAAGAAAVTKRIVLFGTINVPVYNPVVAAKQIADIDQLAQGRLGINLVCGWNPKERQLYGTGHLTHDEQYLHAQEWLDVVRQVWAAGDAPGQYRGTFFDLQHLDQVQGPGTYDGDPILVNAALSPAGRAFAGRNCDFLLHTTLDLDTAKADVEAVKANARDEYGRDVDLIATGHIICRATEGEAREFKEHVLANADLEATKALMDALGLGYDVVMKLGLKEDASPEEQEAHYRQQRDRWVTGHGSYGPIMGTPDQVADEISRFADAGYSGLAFAFTNYRDELPYFAQEVIPRLEARGVRLPVERLDPAEV
jgi:FMNH2-dependent dimethyl sulfone monooxygenase